MGIEFTYLKKLTKQLILYQRTVQFNTLLTITESNYIQTQGTKLETPE